MKRSKSLLSRREQEILRARASGLKREAVAKAFGLCVGTVDYHTNNTYRKLGVNSLVEALQKLSCINRRAA